MAWVSTWIIAKKTNKMMANLRKRREVMVRKGTKEGKVDGQHAGNVRAREGWRDPVKDKKGE